MTSIDSKTPNYERIAEYARHLNQLRIIRDSITGDNGRKITAGNVDQIDALDEAVRVMMRVINEEGWDNPSLASTIEEYETSELQKLFTGMTGNPEEMAVKQRGLIGAILTKRDALPVDATGGDQNTSAAELR